jgi:hypothetical protein
MNLVSVLVRPQYAPDVFAPAVDPVNGPEDHALRGGQFSECNRIMSGTAGSASKAVFRISKLMTESIQFVNAADYLRFPLPGKSHFGVAPAHPISRVAASRCCKQPRSRAAERRWFVSAAVGSC